MTLALEQSLWLRISLYLAFALGSATLAMRCPPGCTFEESPLQRALYALVITVASITVFHFTQEPNARRNSRVILLFGVLFLHLTLVRSTIDLALANILPRSFLYFVIPYGLAPMLHGILLGRAMGALSTVTASIVGCLFVPQSEIGSYLILSLIAGTIGALFTQNIRKRIQLLRAGIYIGLATIGLCLMLGHLNLGSVFGQDAVGNLQTLGLGSLCAFSVALLIALLISGLLPIFEGLFRVTTDISWLELGDLNHKLLRRMQLEAPGTFHHSLIVAALSEAAAETIGANAPMCRVCSYFHDVGKLNKPSYFIENQHDGEENPHDQLTPTMSALIIIAHVKDGVDLAVKHKLNPRIIDIIQEHHGDSLVAYFYRRAQEQKKQELEKVDRKLGNPEDLPAIDEKNFRYPGPRPSTRESAIIALADTIESASRTLHKPTPGRIRAMIDDLIRSKINDDQLDQCPLTLKELDLVKKSFANTLRSMMHTRISYPDDRSNLTQRPSDAENDSQDRVISIPKRA